LRHFLSKVLFRVNILVAVILGLSYLAVYVNPQYFWPVAFLGLMYPVLLLLNIVFVIIWAIKLKPQVFLSLVIVLLGWNFMGRYVQFDIPFKKRKVVSEEKSFKILTFNVRLFDRYNWLKDKEVSHEIFDFIDKESPDIICFQEFFTRYKGELSENEIVNHLKNTKYCHIKYTVSKPGASSFGIATFSKFPIAKRGDILFEKSYNLCIFTDLVIYGDTVRIYNNHLQSIRFIKKNYEFIDSLKLRYNEEEVSGILDITNRMKWAFERRANQAEKVAAHMRLSPYPVIVCGDFNDTPVSYTYRVMSQNLNDAFVLAGSGLGNTYLGKFPSYRIDYIFLDKRFDAFNYRTPKLDLSDHYPVLCRMALKK
jgi:endonuclease/exonuclease/phosphatase family metal-dependent hydrolase